MYVPTSSILSTGVFWKDTLPVTTSLFFATPLLPCARRGLAFQFAVGFVSNVVALLYHYTLYKQYDEFLGIEIDEWRTWDVSIACFCLCIALQHLINADHVLLRLCTAVISPVFLGAMCLINAPLIEHAKILFVNTLVVVIGKCLLPSKREVVYNASYAKVIVPCGILGAIFFPLPVLWPDRYWLYHSLWHVFFGIAMYFAYAELHTGRYISSSSSGVYVKKTSLANGGRGRNPASNPKSE